MQDMTQQKPSEITTNFESIVEQSQTEAQTVAGQEHSQTVNLQSPLISQGQAEEEKPEDQNSGSQDQSHNQQAKNYEQMQEEEHQQYESYQEDQENIEQNKVDNEADAFDKFNDVQTNEKEVVRESGDEEKVIQEKPIQKIQSTKSEEEPIQNVSSSTATNKFAQYQNQAEIETQPSTVQKKTETALQKPQSPEKDLKKKKSKKKQQEGQPLPVVTANSIEGKNQIEAEKKIEQLKNVQASNNGSGPNNGNDKKPQPQPEQKIIQQEAPSSAVSQIKGEVSEIVEPNSVSAGLIIFQAQMQRIGSTLQIFLKYTAKHEKHTTNQKQLIANVEEEISKKSMSKTPLFNTLRDYFDDFTVLGKELYERSYKFQRSEKQMSANPMINMREELKGGIDELIFLRKATGNEFNRMGQFILSSVTKNVVKLFTDYWKAVNTAEAKQKEKKEEFAKKEKQFAKRINKVIKVYTKGKQGSSQQEDLFIEMIKFINQQKQYRTCLIEYGLGLVPLKKAFIKAEEVLYEELQLLFNTFKNQFRTLYSIHPKQFIQIQKMEKFIKEKNTFQKLSDITDGDYVRSVLLTLEKGSVQQLTDKEFEKVLNMLHFEQITGSPVQLLKGTTTKAFELKNKTEQVVDTVSGNLLIFNKQTAQMKEKFIIKNIDARIVQDGVVEIDETLKGIIFDSHRTVRITFRDNDRAEELICFLNQVHENIRQNELANANKK